MVKEQSPQESSMSQRRPSILVMSVVGSVVGIGILLVILAQSIEITIETNPGDRPLSPDVESSTSERASDPEIPLPITNDDFENALELPESNTTASPSIPATTSMPNNGANAAVPVLKGSLRVSNQTIHPVRVALLSQHQDNASAREGASASMNDPADSNSSPESTGESTPIESASSAFREPVHWDFVPGEGAARGLVLGLPDADLAIQPGDVLTAFAQDGSQRYWGPYVVGDTDFPRWNAEAEEWVLILRVNDNLE